MAGIKSLLSSEFIASKQSTEFYHFVKRLADANSKAEEHSIVTQELKDIADHIGLPDISSARMNDFFMRLIYCHMLGYEVDFGTIYAIMSSRSAETRAQRQVAYLACTLFFKPQDEVGILWINTLIRDLKSADYEDRCCALTAVCYIDHKELQEAVLPSVLSCTDFPKQIVRRKAVAALFCISQYIPESSKVVIPELKKALLDKDVSVVFTALSVWKQIISKDAENYEELIPIFVEIMNQILERRIHRSNFYHGVPAPWAQVSILQIFCSYLYHGLGSQQELYAIAVQALTQVERKVDAAYGIILECIRLLSSMDTLFLESMISTTENDPFSILDRFLSSANHNLKYLGLRGLECVPFSLWHDDWKDGVLLANAVEQGKDDETVVLKALKLLDNVSSDGDTDKLCKISEKIFEALRTTSKLAPSLNTEIATWLLHKIGEKAAEPRKNPWTIGTMISSIAATNRNMRGSHEVAKACQYIRETLENEVEDTCLRDIAVDAFYKVLSSNAVGDLDPILLELALQNLGQYGYLSASHSEGDIMHQLLKWVSGTNDEHLLLCGLEATKNCMSRSKIWLTDMEPILADIIRRSSSLELQHISKELNDMIQDREFEKIISNANSSISREPLKLYANPNRPQIPGRYAESASSGAYPKGPLETIKEVSHWASKRTVGPLIRSSSKLQSPSMQISAASSRALSPSMEPSRNAAWRGNQESLVSSLMALELDDSFEEIPRLDTESFGRLWLDYEHEIKFTLDTRTEDAQQVASAINRQWGTYTVQIIANEVIAATLSPSPLLLHAAIMASGSASVTMRASSESKLPNVHYLREL